MKITTQFQKLHEKGKPFILANAWDAGTARLLVAKGAQAVATSSAAQAFTQGLPDMGQVTRAQSLEHARTLVDAVHVPVSGDFENGYGPTFQDVKQTVIQAIENGLAGCSIEDTGLPSSRPYGFQEAVDRVVVAVEAKDQLDEDFVLCARADGVMNGHYELEEAIKRIQAYEEVGANCVYVPMPESWDDLRRVVESVNVPVNALVAGQFSRYRYEDFAEIGVARLSFGSSLARLCHKVVMDASDAIFGVGDFTSFLDVASGDEVDKLLEKGARN